MELRLLSSGIDSLDVSVRGAVRTDLWDALEDARQRAQDDGPDRFWALGRKLTGFAFGQRGAAVYCRVYDKTTEVRKRGLSWLPDLWGDREADVPVWRIEFELRRPVLVQHGLRAVDEVLA